MQTVTIRKLNQATQEICAIRLVGGFDSERKHYPALPQLRFDNKYHLQGIAERAESGCVDSLSLLRRWVICSLVFAKDMMFDGVKYEFDVQSFSEPSSLDFLAWEVMAQVLDQ
ncbi:TPA: hypothetical protein ACOJPK_003559 [Pseudomonas putida]